MSTRVSRWWIGLGSVLLGCTPTPPEVVEVFEGLSSSGEATSNGSGTSADGTGPIVDGSAGSGGGPTSSGPDGTTGPVDSGSTTTPGTSSSSSSGSSSDSSSSGPIPMTCQEIFGTAPNYEFCSEDETTCTFATTTNGNSCNTICMMYGQTCVDAFDNPSSGCLVQGPSTCANNSKGNTMCQCTR